MSFAQGYEQDLAMGCVCDYDTDCPTHGKVDLVGPETRQTVAGLLKERMDAIGLRGLWLPNVRVSRAPDSGSNPGCLYLKSQFGDYLGKILPDGTVRTQYALDWTVKDELRAFVSLGRDYLDEVGKETGQCAYCGLTLTDPDSVVRGYGPICAKKYGLEHPNRNKF